MSLWERSMLFGHHNSSSGRNTGYSTGTPGVPLTAEQTLAQQQAQEAARRKRNIALAATGGGVGVATVGGGALMWGASGFDLVSLCFVLRRKRVYVEGVEKLLGETDFDDAESRTQFLCQLHQFIQLEDVESGYAVPLPLKAKADPAAQQAEALDKQHQTLADVKVEYPEGEHATAPGDRTAPESADDRCVLSLVLTVQRKLARKTKATDDLNWALGTLSTLAVSGNPGVDGAYVLYVPAADEPLPSGMAAIIAGNMHTCDTSFTPTQIVEEEPETPEAAAA